MTAHDQVMKHTNYPAGARPYRSIAGVIATLDGGEGFDKLVQLNERHLDSSYFNNSNKCRTCSQEIAGSEVVENPRFVLQSLGALKNLDATLAESGRMSNNCPVRSNWANFPGIETGKNRNPDL